MYFHLPYRQSEEGIVQGHDKRKLHSIPNYSTISRRINRLDIKIKVVDNKSKGFNDECITIAIDSTGIKVTNRGQWMKEDKWNVRNNKKGFLKIYTDVNVKTQ